MHTTEHGEARVGISHVEISGSGIELSLAEGDNIKASIHIGDVTSGLDDLSIIFDPQAGLTDRAGNSLALDTKVSPIDSSHVFNGTE